jgi:hypothetical protein
MAILRQAEGGVPVPELCREHGLILHLWTVPPLQLDLEAV